MNTRIIALGALLLAGCEEKSQQSAQQATPEEKACEIAAMTDYSNARGAIAAANMEELEHLVDGGVSNYANNVILQRRLQEQYCARFVACISGPNTQIVPQLAFAKCLEDEMREDIENAESLEEH